MGRFIVLTSTLAAMILLLNGCRMCTLAGCSDRLRIIIVQDAYEPTALGTYEVLIQPGGGTAIEMVCEVTSEGGECQVPGEADGGMGFGPSGGSTANGQLTVSIDESPSEVIVEVWSGETLLGEESFEPDYEKHKPNGPKCPPTCYSADVQMLVDTPPQDE